MRHRRYDAPQKRRSAFGLYKNITVEAIVDAVASLCMAANYALGDDIYKALHAHADRAEDYLSRDVLEKLIKNADIAKAEQIPMCQDTGMCVVFAEVGQDVRIIGGALRDAIHQGVKTGYEKGYLRKSVVDDPIRRVNTCDNTPAVIHYDIVPGDKLRLTVAPKGFGSENMSRLAMLKPSQGIDGVRNFIIETVRLAGPNACPPVIVGVGIGGTMEKCALLAKQALLREVGSSHPDPAWAAREAGWLKQINGLGIGPGGFGGMATALAVYIATYPTHIAGLPVAVNMGCHATRHQCVIL